MMASAQNSVQRYIIVNPGSVPVKACRGRLVYPTSVRKVSQGCTGQNTSRYI